jgi:hypothetical protein
VTTGLGATPFVCAVLALAAFSRAVGAKVVPEPGIDRRLAGLTAAFALLVAVMTLAGLVGWLNPVAVALGLVTCAVGAVWIARSTLHRPSASRDSGPVDPPLRLIHLAPLVAPLWLVGGDWLVSVAAPTRTWDGLTYHLPRAVYWVQDGRFAPHLAPDAWTYYEFFPPGGELLWAFAFLGGIGEGLLFLVYLAVSGGLLGAASGLARALGSRRDDAVLAAAVVLATPCVAWQAAAPLVDNVFTLAVLLQAFHAVSAVREESTRHLVLGALAAGVAAATRATGVGLLAGQLVFVGWLAWRRRALSYALVAGVASVLPLAGWSAYTYLHTGSVTYPIEVTALGAFGRGSELLARTLDGSIMSLPPVDLDVAFGRLLGRRNWGLGAIAVVPVGVIAGCLRFRMSGLGALMAWLVGLPLAAWSAEGSSALHTLWVGGSGRLISSSLALLVCFAASPRHVLGRTALWIGLVLMLAQSWTPVTSWSELSAGRLAIGWGLLLLVTLALPWCRVWSTRWRIGFLCLAVFASTGLVKRLDAARAETRHHYYARMTSRSVPRSAPVRQQPEGWKQLDIVRPLRIAVAAGYRNAGHNRFLQPLFGRVLQNRVEYVSPRRDGEIVDTYRPAPVGTSPVDVRAWNERLRSTSVEYVFALPPFPEEVELALVRPDLFEVVSEATDRSYVCLRPLAPAPSHP